MICPRVGRGSAITLSNAFDSVHESHSARCDWGAAVPCIVTIKQNRAEFVAGGDFASVKVYLAKSGHWRVVCFEKSFSVGFIINIWQAVHAGCLYDWPGVRRVAMALARYNRCRSCTFIEIR